MAKQEIIQEELNSNKSILINSMQDEIKDTKFDVVMLLESKIDHLLESDKLSPKQKEIIIAMRNRNINSIKDIIIDCDAKVQSIVVETNEKRQFALPLQDTKHELLGGFDMPLSYKEEVVRKGLNNHTLVSSKQVGLFYEAIGQSAHSQRVLKSIFDLIPGGAKQYFNLLGITDKDKVGYGHLSPRGANEITFGRIGNYVEVYSGIYSPGGCSRIDKVGGHDSHDFYDGDCYSLCIPRLIIEVFPQ